ncbi:MAG: gamma-glutamyl-gamma-aminobutyrate hydrolase family protein [Halarsenatibacteraceae bacterium]
MNTPLIGITTFCKQENPEREESKYNKVNCNYINAISEAGGQPIIIPELSNLKKAEKYIDLIDGLVFSGGQDISPVLYGETPISELETDLVRDKWELELFKLAYQEKIPLLGICRGMQLFNIALGGTLYQDIIEQYDKELVHLAKNEKNQVEYIQHKVSITEGTKLSEYMCEDEIIVNSYHHQSVRETGKNLKVAAKSQGGIIEAIETTEDRFLIGVQWHPEDLIKEYLCFNNLFGALIKNSIKNNRST